MNLGTRPHEQMLPVPSGVQYQAASYPVFFYDGKGDRVYCNATVIDTCQTEAEGDAGAGAGAGCCYFVRAGKQPGAQIPNVWLIFASLVAPILAFAFNAVHLTHSRADPGRRAVKFSRTEFRSAILGFTLAWAATFTATELVKRSIGAPRPNFYSLSALLEYDERAGTDAYGKFRDERYMNIPSGHSSMSMVSFLYLTLFMTTKVHVLMRSDAERGRDDDERSNGDNNDEQEHTRDGAANAGRPPALTIRSSSINIIHDTGFDNGNNADADTGMGADLAESPRATAVEDWKWIAPANTPAVRAAKQWFLFLACAPVLAAVWVAVTRVEDYWHSPPAVLFGELLGALCALFGWCTVGAPYLVPFWSGAVRELSLKVEYSKH